MNVLLFDFDGTIVDSLKVAHKAYNAVAKQYKLKKIVHEKDFSALYDQNIYQSFLKQGVPQEKIGKFMLDLRNAFFNNGYRADIFPGVRKTFALLAKDNLIFIVTSNLSPAVKKLLNDAKLSGVTEILGGDHGKSKVKKIEYIKPLYPEATIYYIGDTVGDIVEGKQAGVKTVAVTWGYHSKAKLQKAEPDYIVDKPKELVEILN